MAIKDKLPLGTRIGFTAISESRYALPQGKDWDEWDDGRHVIKIPRQGSGIICGVRVLQEGRIEEIVEDFPDGPGTCNVWKCTKHVDVYLVAVNYGQIVRVQPEDIVPLQQI